MKQITAGQESMRRLSGWPLIAVMCIGQVGNLLPHVTLSANLAQHLMPAWGLSAAEGGLMASGFAFGYMLAVPVLTRLTDCIDARIVLGCGSILSGLAAPRLASSQSSNHCNLCSTGKKLRLGPCGCCERTIVHTAPNRIAALFAHGRPA